MNTAVIISVFIVVIVLYPVLQWVVLPYFHDLTLERFAIPLVSIAPPAETRNSEVLTRVGQQAANGDHCDYLAALMVETKLPSSEVQAYYTSQYKGKAQVEFIWLNEKNAYTTDELDISVIHTLKDWIKSRSKDSRVNVVVYTFEPHMTSAIDYRCS